jgi:hypothetical protein
MAEKEQQSEPDDARSSADEERGKRAAPRATQVRTSDANITSPAAPPPPERSVEFQTSALPRPANPYPFPCDPGPETGAERNGGNHRHGQEGKQPGSPDQKKQDEDDKGDGGRQSFQHERHKGNRERRHQGEESDVDDGDRDDGNGDERQRQGAGHKKRKKKKGVRSRLPGWPTLLITAVLALACGVGGAWGYSALFGSSDKQDQDSKKGKGSDKAGGSGKSGGKSGGSDSDPSSDVKGLKKNLGDLDDDIKQLTSRLDRLTESLLESRLPVPEFYPGTSRIARMAPANAESPPILPKALPTQLNMLERKVEQMADLATRVEALEELMPLLQEEIKTLDARRAAP